MVATSIQFRAADEGPPSPYVPFEDELTLTALPNSEVRQYRWQTTGGIEIVAGGQSNRVTIRGARVDERIGASTLSVTVDGGALTAILSLTVVSLDRVVAEVQSTPPTRSNRARAALQLLDPPPLEFPSTRVRELLDPESTLVLIGGAPPQVTVRAEVRPRDVPIVWSSMRDPGDGAGDQGLAPSPTSGTKTSFATSKVGAYYVTAAVDVRSGIPLSWSMKKTLPVVLVGVTKVTDNSQYANAFKPSTELERLCFASNEFQRDATPSRVFSYASGEDFVKYDAELELASGGPNGDLFLDQVEARWIQTARGTSRGGADEMVGRYASGASVASGLVASWFARGRTYVFDQAVLDPLAYPVPDAQDDDTPPVVARSELLTDGKVWTVRGEDLPNTVVPAYFSGGDEGDPLRTVTLDVNFSAYVCLWTKQAPRAFGVAYQLDWALVGGWSITQISPLQVTVTQQPEVRHQGRALLPVQPADQAGAEVLGPGNVDHLVLVQTKAR